MPDAKPPAMTPAKLRAWAVEMFLPFWADAGYDADSGCFFEAVDLQGRPVVDLPTRTRVQARQIYTMAAAYRLTGLDRYRKTATFAARWLIAHGRRSEDGLYGKLLDRSGVLADRSVELYEQAFVLFALAHAAGVADDKAPFEQAANSLIAAVDAHMTGPGGGFHAALPASGPRLQNPHMHLLEACLAWIPVATEREGWRARARALVGLFCDRIYDPDTATVTEYLVEDWSAPDPARGHEREPGHACEWAWLLWQAARHGFLDPTRAAAMAQAMSSNALKTGTPPGANHGLGLSLSVKDGSWIEPSRRTWPQTEALKAALAIYEATGEEADRDQAKARLNDLFNGWMRADSPLWWERRAPDGTARDVLCPASTPYHVMVAVEDALRILEMPDA